MRGSGFLAREVIEFLANSQEPGPAPCRKVPGGGRLRPAAFPESCFLRRGLRSPKDSMCFSGMTQEIDRAQFNFQRRRLSRMKNFRLAESVLRDGRLHG